MDKGQNLVEFSIVIALVAIVCIVVLSMLGVNINTLFGSSNTKINDFKPFGISYDKNTGKMSLKAGELGGTASNPKKACSGDVCSIDYGDFVINGLPTDFGEFVEANGTSGGTEKMIATLEQIAEQLEKAGDPAGAQDYRELANIGHYLSKIHESVEKSASECDSMDTTCLSSKLENPLDSLFPANLSTIMSPTSQSAKDIYLSDLGNARHDKNDDPSKFSDDKSRNPIYAFIEKYDSIINNSKYSDTLKGVTQELYLNIADLTSGLTDKVQGLDPHTNVSGEEGQRLIYDPLTGNHACPNLFTENLHLCTHQTFVDTMDEITHPQTSKGSNINSALICVAGKNLDTGKSCH